MNRTTRTTRPARKAPHDGRHVEALERRTLMSGASEIHPPKAALDSFARSDDGYTFEMRKDVYTDAQSPWQVAASQLAAAEAKLNRPTAARAGMDASPSNFSGPFPSPTASLGHTPFAAEVFSSVRIHLNDVVNAPYPELTRVVPGTQAADPEAARAEQLVDHSFAGRPPKRLPEPSTSGTERHVLLVEDDRSSRLALTVLLRDRGWNVTPVATLAEGIRELASRPDEVIVDLMLPDGDGATLLKYVRDAHLPVRVTVTTAVSDTPRLERVRRLHPDALLTKPLDMPRLVKALSSN